MRALIQRVKRASVTINSEVTGKINNGLLIFLGVGEDDTEKQVQYLVEKCTGLRIFTDEQDKMNLSVKDINGEILIVSQFTLFGDCKKGKRPSFVRAARPETAIPLYESFIANCKNTGLNVQTGEFGADMQIELINDGPVTIWLDTEEMGK
ncbi:MAG TPA: D-tyrosyl-tRNA(Tyr) deacylase [Candidatus Butyricicoccus avistercoris]|uniref:D-aminoacyl-tRNA deacylase n=1 Tax=Candidatus Butyricicoccus avistercoris TaxID=2838518 RepID=A0A9D1PIR5_9FIRM|nr:D-tyrosyl-tRNA(Tyr) deacylase [Candidatus Butyricicoccus avistercoris]